jgi:hypothetical protein
VIFFLKRLSLLGADNIDSVVLIVCWPLMILVMWWEIELFVKRRHAKPDGLLHNQSVTFELLFPHWGNYSKCPEGFRSPSSIYIELSAVYSGGRKVADCDLKINSVQSPSRDFSRAEGAASDDLQVICRS